MVLGIILNINMKLIEKKKKFKDKIKDDIKLWGMEKSLLPTKISTS